MENNAKFIIFFTIIAESHNLCALQGLLVADFDIKSNTGQQESKIKRTILTTCNIIEPNNARTIFYGCRLALSTNDSSKEFLQNSIETNENCYSSKSASLSCSITNEEDSECIGRIPFGVLFFCTENLRAESNKVIKKLKNEYDFGNLFKVILIRVHSEIPESKIFQIRKN